jgi:peptidyl-prolyl cis-trans isomerase B (cyclophilin B)
VPRSLTALAVSLAALALGACGSDDEKKDEPAKNGATATQEEKPATTATTATTAAKPRCRKVPAPKRKRRQRIARPTLELDEDKTYEAVFNTSCGSFTVTLDVKESPRTSASFVHLAREGLYDGLTFHRIVPGFVIQGGDPRGNGQGGPGYTVVEPPPDNVSYTKGVVAMAKTEIEDPGTSGSQFYVVTAEDAQLPPDYAVLGKVTAGQDVVDLIGIARTDQTNPDPAKRERPVDPIVIRSVKISEK